MRDKEKWKMKQVIMGKVKTIKHQGIAVESASFSRKEVFASLELHVTISTQSKTASNSYTMESVTEETPVIFSIHNQIVSSGYAVFVRDQTEYVGLDMIQIEKEQQKVSIKRIAWIGQIYLMVLIAKFQVLF